MKRKIFPEEFGRFKMNRFTSRKFLMAFFAALFIILNEGLEWGIPHEAYWIIVTLVVTYIAGESAVDISRR